MTEEVKPATDQEIKEWWQHNCNDRRACNFGQTGPCREQSLFARIEQDRRRLEAAEKLAKASVAQLDSYREMESHGDCGHWNVDDEPVVRALLDALKEWEAAK